MTLVYRFRKCSFLVILLALVTSVQGQPTIWLAPLSTATFDNKPGASDYMSLFVSSAPWQQVAKSIAVFKLYPAFVERASDAELRSVFSDLKRRGIALALEARVLSATKGCGMQRGDGGDSTINIVGRIHRLGGDLRYIAMDEPLQHGLNGEKYCQATLTQMAVDVAENARKFRDLFPQVQIGDIEPIGTWPKAPNRVAEVLAWVEAYRDQVHEPLAFLHSDVGWKTSWLGPNTYLAQELKQHGIPFGIIYNSTDPPISDVQWATETAEHYKAFERSGEPDHVIFQTWRPYPTKVLPESDPLTLTGVVEGYLQYSRQKQPAAGQLGKP